MIDAWTASVLPFCFFLSLLSRAVERPQRFLAPYIPSLPPRPLHPSSFLWPSFFIPRPLQLSPSPASFILPPPRPAPSVFPVPSVSSPPSSFPSPALLIPSHIHLSSPASYTLLLTPFALHPFIPSLLYTIQSLHFPLFPSSSCLTNGGI